jgi:hypothetical protein
MITEIIHKITEILYLRNRFSIAVIDATLSHSEVAC